MTPGGTSIAYQCFGEAGPVIVSVPPMAQNIEMAWEWPAIRRMFEGFATFARFVPFDKRGTGMSDRSLNIPRLDERVDELSAVLDHLGTERAFVMGTSEGGPMALLFAATYPERVRGVILESSTASLRMDTGEDRSAKEAFWPRFIAGWGTPESIFVDHFAPSLADDDEFRVWHQRYERNAASREAIGVLVELGTEMDAQGVLHRIECPVLIVHRAGDRVIPIARARWTAGLLRSHGVEVDLVEMPGPDHLLYAADLEMALAAIERFTTGQVSDHRPGWLGSKTATTAVTTMGRFEIVVDGAPVATAEWGSKRARTLLKRLVVARGAPVTRDELFDLLWPEGSDGGRLSARLSVQLSAVRRVLRGGVIADRSSVRLDLAHVDVDIERWFSHTDDAAIVAGHTGEFLPDDRYDDWARPLRDEICGRFVEAASRMAARGPLSEAAGIWRRVLTADPYDERAHRSLVGALRADGQLGQARAAYQAYVAAMDDLSIDAASWDDLGS